MSERKSLTARAAPRRKLASRRRQLCNGLTREHTRSEETGTPHMKVRSTLAAPEVEGILELHHRSDIYARDAGTRPVPALSQDCTQPELPRGQQVMKSTTAALTAPGALIAKPEMSRGSRARRQ